MPLYRIDGRFPASRLPALQSCPRKKSGKCRILPPPGEGPFLHRAKIRSRQGGGTGEDGYNPVGDPFQPKVKQPPSCPTSGPEMQRRCRWVRRRFRRNRSIGRGGRFFRVYSRRLTGCFFPPFASADSTDRKHMLHGAHRCGAWRYLWKAESAAVAYFLRAASALSWRSASTQSPVESPGQPILWRRSAMK